MERKIFVSMTERKHLTGSGDAANIAAVVPSSTSTSTARQSASIARHSPRSSWTEKLFDNLLPHSDEVQEETMEQVAQAYRTRKDEITEMKLLPPQTPSSAPSSLLPSLSRKTNSPKGRGIDGNTKFHNVQQKLPPHEVVIRRAGGAASRGPFTSIMQSCSESNTPSKSGSMATISSSTDSISTPMDKTLDAETEMMDRLLQLIHDDDDDRNQNEVSDVNNVYHNSRKNVPSGQNDAVLSSKSAGNTCNETPAISDKLYWKEKKYIQRYINELINEREKLKEAWKAEFEEEERKYSSNSASALAQSVQKSWTSGCLSSMLEYLSHADAFISNMPLTIGAVGLSWVTQGTVWFKFMEEFVDSCAPTHYFDPKCVYYEFPSCFACDTTNSTYKTALLFHLICHTVAAVCCILFFGKCVLAWRLVVDELSNPTTATPMGVVCITVICVLAGRFGLVGEIGVLSVSIFHVLLSFWFLYIAVVRFRLWPDPSWFPCTVGIAYASVKSWLYFPRFGWALMILCIVYFIGTFFLAIFRAYTNMKISAPVCFITLSAPSITMYAMTTVAQPSPEREAILETSPELTTRWDEIHRNGFVPVMHVMMFLSIVGFASSLHSLAVRWDEFNRKPFSPAHAAFVFPVLSHTNAIQSYRRVIIGFSLQPSTYHYIITVYWIFCLLGGTIINLIFTTKYVSRLPKWTNFDKVTEDEEGDEALLNYLPPEPKETIVHEMWADTNAHEALRKQFSNPAVLQANEAGILVRRRRGTDDYYRKGPYTRSRRITSIGFDPMLSLEELRKERAELLDWVVKINPRQRNKTMSIPVEGYGTFGIRSDAGSPQHESDDHASHRRTRTDLV